jgi:SAM-dependent methyltransferase
MNDKLTYLTSSSRKLLLGIGTACPNCGARQGHTVDRKYVVTTLQRCAVCQLLFRSPTTSEAENARFYQRRYEQGITTSMPSDEQLQQYMKSGFPGKDYSSRIAVVKAAVAQHQHRLFDFGCSWGYGSYQFAQAGFQVQAFEISKPRANFARAKLGIDVCSDLSAVKGPFDIFFSSHVLEHVPRVQETMNLAWKVLAPGGLFVAFTPNGSESFRKAEPQQWHGLWGNVHPNFLDDVFYRKAIEAKPVYLSSGGKYDHEDIRRWSAAPVNITRNLGHYELLAIARK